MNSFNYFTGNSTQTHEQFDWEVHQNSFTFCENDSFKINQKLGTAKRWRCMTSTFGVVYYTHFECIGNCGSCGTQIVWIVQLKASVALVFHLKIESRRRTTTISKCSLKCINQFNEKNYVSIYFQLEFEILNAKLWKNQV